MVRGTIQLHNSHYKFICQSLNAMQIEIFLNLNDSCFRMKWILHYGQIVHINFGYMKKYYPYSLCNDSVCLHVVHSNFKNLECFVRIKFGKMTLALIIVCFLVFYWYQAFVFVCIPINETDVVDGYNGTIITYGQVRYYASPVFQKPFTSFVKLSNQKYEIVCGFSPQIWHLHVYRDIASYELRWIWSLALAQKYPFGVYFGYVWRGEIRTEKCVDEAWNIWTVISRCICVEFKSS